MWSEEIARRLAAVRQAGRGRWLQETSGLGVECISGGRPLIAFASNDYLGLASHPAVIQAGQEALARSGAGAGASRLISGTKSEHVQLERALAGFKESQACLVFPSGYQAALAVLGALLAGDSQAAGILDRHAHACLLDGAWLSGSKVRTFRHNDLADLRRVLEREAGKRILVVVESLYSMDGDQAPLGQIASLVGEYGGWLLVDEAHATGVLGPNGRGLLAAHFPGPLPEHVLALGTLSKALGAQGGFLCAASSTIEWVLNAGRAFIFSTALAPAAAASALAALDLVRAHPEMGFQLVLRSEELRSRLQGLGLAVLGGPGPILPVAVGEESRAVEAAGRLAELGFLVPAVRFPTVKKGQARLRLSLSCLHTPDHIGGLVEAFRKSLDFFKPPLAKKDAKKPNWESPGHK